MTSLREEQRVGLDYLETVTTLLQRIRAAHPTKGTFEASDLQWWWRTPRPTDEIPQLFWFDEHGPAAAIIATDWRGDVALAPMTLPDAPRELLETIIERGVAHADTNGLGSLDLEVDRADGVLQEVLVANGFTTGSDDGEDAASISVFEAWMPAAAKPAITPVHDGYRSLTRLDTMDQPHHMIKRNGEHVEARLRQTSLYRPDLDLVILDKDGNAAASGIFWMDPVTETGQVEPMRTEEEHQRRGLARHIITTGVNRLVDAGAKRIKICFEPDNEAAKGLYLDVGFEPVKQTVVFTRPDPAAT